MFDPIEAVKSYIRIPSISTDSRYRKSMREALAYASGLLETIGLETDTVETPLHPILLGRRQGPDAWPHVIIYGHYDVQPPDPVEAWESPPFEPEIRDGRLYGRGAADNKGPQMVHLAALGDLLEREKDLPLRVTVLLEGEEEIGSPSLPGFLQNYRDKLKGDFVLLSDTASVSPREICITTGLRGVMCMEVCLHGPKSDLHSGMFGGAVVNPIAALSRLCASLHDEDGRVNVPGFYDAVRPVLAWEKEELARLPLTEADLRKALGVEALRGDPEMTPIEATRFLPTLEFNGIGGGYQGEGSKTIIPSKASVKISCRLVPDQDPEVIRTLVMNALRERCPSGVRLEEIRDHDGNPYLLTPPGKPNAPADQPVALKVAFSEIDKAVKEVFGTSPLYVREGGSVPIIADLKRELGLDSLMLGMFTPEDNLHAPNEGMDLEMFARGIEVSKRVLRRVASAGSVSS